MGTKSEFLYNDFYYTSSEKQALLDKLKMGTQEWAKKELNCIKGCHNNCIYCYGKSIAKRFKRCTEETWKHMEINKLAINKNYQKVKKEGNQPYDIMFPTSHDIFIKEPYLMTYIKMLKKLVIPGNSVLIVSKPNPKVIEIICENFKKYKEKLGFRFTIGSVDSKLLRLFEPNAPSFEDRLKALKIAKDNKFNTSISVEPLLDDDPKGLINKLSPHLSNIDYKLDIGTIWIGLLKINYIPLLLRVGKVKDMIDRIKKKQEFENVFSYYSRFYDNERVKWKESILKLMILNNVRVKEFYY